MLLVADLENHYTALKNARKSGHTFGRARQPEGGQGADDAEDIVGEDRRNPLGLGVGAVQDKTRAAGGDDLLLLGSSKLAEDCLVHGGGRLDGQGVHEQVGGGRHGGGCCRPGGLEQIADSGSQMATEAAGELEAKAARRLGVVAGG